MITWFIHFHKAAGSSIVKGALLNKETLPLKHSNGNLTSLAEPEGILYREMPDEDFRNLLDHLLENKVTFVASEWDVPNLNILFSHEKMLFSI